MNILYVIHNLGSNVPESKSGVIAGGAEISTYAMAHTLRADNVCYILYMDLLDRKKLFLHKISMFKNETIEQFICETKFHKTKVFQEILTKYEIDIIHYQHLIHCPMEYVVVGKAAKIPQLLTAHDYFYICEEHFLQSEKLVTCEVPMEIEKCCMCLQNKLDVEPLKVALRRQMMKEVLNIMDRVYVPSKSLRIDYFRIYPEINDKLEVAPIGVRAIPPVDISKVAGLHIGIPSYLTYVKGLTRILNVLRLCEERLPEVKFHILSDTMEEATSSYLKNFSNVCLEDTDFDKVNLIWLPSIAKETFSLLLSESLYRTIPVMAEDIGAFSERMKGKDFGFLYRKSASPEDIYSLVSSIIKERDSLVSISENIKKHRDEIPTLEFMCAYFSRQYNILVKKS